MALTIDGTPATNNVSGGTTLTVALTTSLTNDIIVICTHVEELDTTRTVSTITGGGLTFALRKQLLLGPVDPSARTMNSLEVWWALAPSALSGVTFTITYSGTIDDATCVAFAVNGADTAAPWDTNGSLPATATATTSGIPTVTGISTTAADTVLIGACGSGANGTTQTAGATYTLVGADVEGGGDNFSTIGVQRKIVSAAQAGVSQAFGTSYGTNWLMIADAIKAPAVALTAESSLRRKTLFRPGSGPDRGLTPMRAYPDAIVAAVGGFGALLSHRRSILISGGLIQ